MSENRRSPTNSPSSPLKRTDLHKKCKMPKGKKHMNRGSNRPPYLPVPFLSSTKTPGVRRSLVTPPSTCCLNRIEPRFEPRARQPQVAIAHVGDTSSHAQTPRGRFWPSSRQAKQSQLCSFPLPSFLFPLLPLCPLCLNCIFPPPFSIHHDPFSIPHSLFLQNPIQSDPFHPILERRHL